LIVKDATGVKYLLKFDPTDEPPELETGNHVIVNRLLWACGYNVAEDRIVYLRSEDLVLAPDATVKDLTAGDQRRLDRPELERDLREGPPRDPTAGSRALASRWIDGVTLGGHPAEGGARRRSERPDPARAAPRPAGRVPDLRVGRLGRRDRGPSTSMPGSPTRGSQPATT